MYRHVSVMLSGGRQVPWHGPISFRGGLSQQVADAGRMRGGACSPQVEAHGSQGRQVRPQGLRELCRP